MNADNPSYVRLRCPQCGSSDATCDGKYHHCEACGYPTTPLPDDPQPDMASPDPKMAPEEYARRQDELDRRLLACTDAKEMRRIVAEGVALEKAVTQWQCDHCGGRGCWTGDYRTDSPCKQEGGIDNPPMCSKRSLL